MDVCLSANLNRGFRDSRGRSSDGDKPSGEVDQYLKDA